MRVSKLHADTFGGTPTLCTARCYQQPLCRCLVPSVGAAVDMSEVQRGSTLHPDLPSRGLAVQADPAAGSLLNSLLPSLSFPCSRAVLPEGAAAGAQVSEDVEWELRSPGALQLQAAGPMWSPGTGHSALLTLKWLC